MTGFSFIELLITLVLVAIVAVLAVPSFQIFATKSQGEVMASRLFKAIQLTRNEAISRNTSIRLCKSLDQKTCSGDWQDGFIVLSADEGVLYSFHNEVFKGVLHWRAFPLDKDSLTFNSFGFPQAQNGTFWLCNKDQTTPLWAIIINQAGRARILYPDGSNLILDDKKKPLNC